MHSAALDENGDAIDGNSFYSKFMSRLRKDWDVVDEGPMSDLLGIDCDRRPDGSILLNQGKYIQKMLAKFAPNGPLCTSGVQYLTALTFPAWLSKLSRILPQTLRRIQS